MSHTRDAAKFKQNNLKLLQAKSYSQFTFKRKQTSWNWHLKDGTKNSLRTLRWNLKGFQVKSRFNRKWISVVYEPRKDGEVVNTLSAALTRFKRSFIGTNVIFIYFIFYICVTTIIIQILTHLISLSVSLNHLKRHCLFLISQYYISCDCNNSFRMKRWFYIQQ